MSNPRGLPRQFITQAAREGGTRSQIFKRAWQLFRASKPAQVVERAIKRGRVRLKRPRRARRGTMSNPDGRRRRRFFRRRRMTTIPLAPILGLAAGVIEPITWAISGYPDMPTAVRKAGVKLISNYTGVEFDSSLTYPVGWSWTNLSRGLIPLVAGLLVHKFVGGAPLNFNRTLARARVPWVRI